MTRPTIIFEPGDLIHVPFPHVERAALVRRPALIVALRDTGAVGLLLWTLMITNAQHPPWQGDIVIPDAERQGLIIPSKVRTAKIATVSGDQASRIGRLDASTWARVRRDLTGAIGPP